MKAKKKGPPVGFWQPDKLKLIKKLYPKTDNETAAKQIGCTVRALRSKANVLGLSKSTRYWSKKQEQHLLKQWDAESAADIAKTLNKTVWAVINKYRSLKGLRVDNAYKSKDAE